MLDLADLEVNVLEFRQRAFSFETIGVVEGEEFAVFGRTETSSESKFRPPLVQLKVLAPRAWVVYDATNDILLFARDGATVPPRRTEPVVEIGAERPEFNEQGIDWRRVRAPNGVFVYAPGELAATLLRPEAFAGLGIA